MEEISQTAVGLADQAEHLRSITAFFRFEVAAPESERHRAARGIPQTVLPA